VIRPAKYNCSTISHISSTAVLSLGSSHRGWVRPTETLRAACTSRAFASCASVPWTGHMSLSSRSKMPHRHSAASLSGMLIPPSPGLAHRGGSLQKGGKFVFCSDNCQQFCDYVSLGHEVRCHQAEVPRASRCWSHPRGHSQTAWHQPANCDQLGAGNAIATAERRPVPEAVDTGQQVENRLTSVFI